MTATALLGLALALPVEPPRGAKPLPPAVLEQALEKLPEAAGQGAAIRAWANGREQLWLREKRGVWSLWSRSESLELPPELGPKLENTRQYFSLTEPTLARPITFEELTAALTSRAGVRTIQALFEDMIERRVAAGGKLLFPERGGEATLDRELELHEWPEPTRDAIPRLAASIDNEDELRRLRDTEPGVATLDEHGLLKSLLSHLPAWHARGDPPERIAKVRRLTVMTLLENGAKSFVFDPASQLRAIAGQSWRGRFIGHWHVHPPHWTPVGFTGGAEPSPPDLEIAAKTGQNLTIAFTADGFDAYDLSALGEAEKADLRLARVVRYRSEEWRRRFARLHGRLPRP
ncbi:MAG: hypothetical protein HY553_00225 [Elusimicrobia bacterium]|nr:hypothetical protein [Elusimicrobiota bacterium]